jgi:MtN3 and saliva related transmembrane protein
MTLYIEIIGYVGSFILAFMSVPQIINVYKTKSAKDLSYGMFIMLFIGYIFFMLYGILIHSIPIISSVALSICNCVHLTWLKYYFDRKNKITELPTYPI